MVLTCGPVKQLYKAFLLFFLLGALFFPCSKSSAYDLNEIANWKQEEIVFETSFPPLKEPLTDGSTSWNQVAQAAADEWNYYLEAMGANLKITIKPVSIIPQESWDLWINGGSKKTCKNEIHDMYFSLYEGSIPFQQGVHIAACSLNHDSDNNYVRKYPTDYYGGYFLKEVDIIFNAATKWDSHRTPGVVNNTRDFYRVALHEMGHALGLNHNNLIRPSDVKSIMNTSYGFQFTHLQQDDIDGVAAKRGVKSVPVAPQFAEPAPIEQKQAFQQYVYVTSTVAEKFTKRFAKFSVGGFAYNLESSPENTRLVVSACGRAYQPQLRADNFWFQRHVRLNRKRNKHLVWAYVINSQGHILAQQQRRVRISAYK